MRIIAAVLLSLLVTPAMAALDWETALTGEHRSDRNKARDEYRHPRETLEFFGLEEGMTAVELAPGGGWYTEVIAPLLHGNGVYYAAHYSPNGGGYSRRALGGYLRKLGENDDIYGEVVITTLAPAEGMPIAPAGTADLVLTFRNVHNWIAGDTLDAVFSAAYDALKPGGVFGVVEHRASDDRSVADMADSGYVSEAHVIATARAAGFELDARSEINANPKDPTDHAGGVWELPPTLGGDDDDAKLAIGESDRMTLRFVKPSE